MKIMILPVLAVALTGCAPEDYDSTRPASRIQPVIDGKPTKAQREAIMSGGTPDWSEHGYITPHQR